MGQTRLLLWRHGVTAWNADRRFQGRNADVPLTEEGLAQAAAAAPGVIAYRPAAIVCSPLLRARRTAEAAARLMAGIEIGLDDRLAEMDVGGWCGLTWDQVHDLDPAYAVAEADGRDYRCGETGETGTELGVRVGAGLRAVAVAGQSVLVVSHGWAIQAGVADLLGWSYEQALSLRVMGNCALSILSQREDGRWRLDTWNARV